MPICTHLETRKSKTVTSLRKEKFSQDAEQTGGKKSTACQYNSINLLGNKNDILITIVTRSVKHLETNKRNVHNPGEENTNFTEGFSYSSHLLKRLIIFLDGKTHEDNVNYTHIYLQV